MSLQPPALPTGTVMPVVKVHRAPHGVRLVHPTDQGATNFAVQVAVGVIFVLIGATIAMPGLVFGAPLPVVVGAVMVLAGGAVLVSAGIWLYQRTTLQDAHLDLPRLPLRLGEAATVHFSQRRTGRSPIRSFTATLICQEWVRYRRGTAARTDTHQIWSQPLPARPSDPLGKSTLLKGTWHLYIPPELPPSFTLPDNAVQWLLTVHADVENRPAIVTTFTLPVLPEVISDLR